MAGSRASGSRLFEAAGGLLAGVEMAQPNEAGNDAGFNGRDPTARTTGQNEMVGQAVQGMEGGRAAIDPTGTINRAGFLIQKAGHETKALVFPTDATRAGKQLIVSRQCLCCKHLCHSDALTPGGLALVLKGLRTIPRNVLYQKRHLKDTLCLIETNLL
jgi:hypothetical protein